MDEVDITHYRGALGTLIVEHRLECQSSCIESMQQFIEPEYAKVRFRLIHQ
jgi:hypothetical protein